MLVLQHNCRRAYAITIAALELGLQLGVGLACLQEPYIDRDFCHGGYLLYWPKGGRRSCRVVIAVRRDLLDQLIIEARTDLISHPYILTVDIWDLDRAREKARSRAMEPAGRRCSDHGDFLLLTFRDGELGA